MRLGDVRVAFAPFGWHIEHQRSRKIKFRSHDRTRPDSRWHSYTPQLVELKKAPIKASPDWTARVWAAENARLQKAMPWQDSNITSPAPPRLSRRAQALSLKIDKLLDAKNLYTACAIKFAADERERASKRLVCSPPPMEFAWLPFTSSVPLFLAAAPNPPDLMNLLATPVHAY